MSEASHPSHLSHPSPPLLRFAGTHGPQLVALPFVLDELVADWGALRSPMARHLPEAFRRDEWAHLMHFLAVDNLRRPFEEAFGAALDPATPVSPGGLWRPAGPVAVWLPNNVSLLGPLCLVWLSLTGNPLWLKGGSRSDDLTGAFLDFAREHLPPGRLREHLEENVRYERFERGDARHGEWAARARVRLVFGSDAAAQAIEALPHPSQSRGFAFVDRRSEAWIAKERLDPATLEALIAVFAVYGQAGCTSPRRVVLLGAEEAEARALRDRLVELWPRVVRERVPPHTASGNVMARQWAACLGWDATLAPEHAAVLASGPRNAEDFEAPMALCVVGRSLEEALVELPENIQTIGHALPVAGASGVDVQASWWPRLAARGVKRFVPLERMHHFAPAWDGMDFWRQTFEWMEIDA